MKLTMPKLEGNEYLLAFGDLLPRSSQSSTIVTPRDDRTCGSAIGGKVLAVDTGLEGGAETIAPSASLPGGHIMLAGTGRLAG
jgi:hypothetical protein